MRYRTAAAASLALLALGQAAAFADPARDGILADLSAQAKQADPAFAGFSAERGQALYRGPHGTSDPKVSACTSCHGDDPRVGGQNVKTGKPIEPMAVSANPKRYTNQADVEKCAFIYQMANPSEGGRNDEAGNNGWWPTGLERSVSCARSMK